MKWALGITTAPRTREYLSQTIISLQDAGWDDKLYVFAEPQSAVDDYGPHVQIVRNEKVLGAWRNWRRALSSLRASVPAADFYALAQDDIAVRPGLRNYLETAISKHYISTGVFSPYLSKTEYRRSPLGERRKGWQKCGSGWSMCGACFLVMMRPTARLLDVKLPRITSQNQHIDGHLALHLKNTSQHMWIHNPSLVQHLADADSTLGYKANPAVRTAFGYIEEPIEVQNVTP